MTDARSPLTVKILNVNPEAYRELVVEHGTPALAQDLLESVKPGELVSMPITSPDAGLAVLAGLWLWHDGLAECHRVVQGEPARQEIAATFNFWHAIMHRREGDFSNSKYWYRRAAEHPVLPAIGQQVGDLINQLPADKKLLRLVRDRWNPEAFVDLVEEAHRSAEHSYRELLIRIQQLEWRMLFEHSVREATTNSA
jgi:hypothetical protein